MTTPISSISGLISGFDYQTLVNTIIADARAPAARMEAQIASNTAEETAITTYRGLLDAVRAASKTLRDGTALDATTATTTVLTGSAPLATVTTNASATNGNYTLTVQNLAKAEKLSSTTATDATTALGQTGTFTVNGQTVTVGATDTLASIRDKVNALNSGSTPTGVTASILTVSPTDSRLILTSTATGAAGVGLADTSGTVLQSLGYINGLGAKLAGAILVPGADAHFTIDNIPLTRTSNVVSDAIDGVTITLTSDAAGASTQIGVGRYADAASATMKTFVDAYNALVGFLKDQNTPGSTTNPPLYGDSLLRTARSALPTLLLQTIGGAAPDLATMASVGVSLTRDGTLTYDAAKFTNAFNNRYADVRALFTEQLNATGANITFASSGSNMNEGSRDINITAAATQATLETTGFSGTYNDGGTPDTVTVTDTNSGKSADIVLTTGMTTSDIVQAMHDAFAAQGLDLTASADGNDIRLTQGSYGSRAGITIAVSGTGDGGSEAFSAATSAFGIDIAGTIGGEAATGAGQTLVGNTNTSQAGISLRYTGTATGAIGSVDLGLGSGARIERLLNSFLDSGTGSLDVRNASLDRTNISLQDRVTQFDARLARQRAVLLATFVQMETAISRLQTQSQSLLGTITASTAALTASSSSSSTSGG